MFRPDITETVEWAVTTNNQLPARLVLANWQTSIVMRGFQPAQSAMHCRRAAVVQWYVLVTSASCCETQVTTHAK